MKRFSLFFLFITIFFTTNLYSADKIRIAILSLEGRNVPAATSSTITEMITTEMVTSRAFEVVERNQMDGILKEQGFQQSGCTDQECAIKIGKLISARKILIGAVSKMGSIIIMNIRMVDVEKGIAELAAMEQAESDDKIPAAVKRIVKKITDEGEFDVGKEEEEDVAATEEEPAEQYTMTGYYLRGIVPGWGQIYSGSETKGYIFMAGFVLAGAAAVYGVMDFNTKKDEYMDLPLEASQSEFDKKNDAKKSAGLFALSMISVTGLIYAANWVDLIFFTKTPVAKTSTNGTGTGDICFNPCVNLLSPLNNERQYSLSFGLRF